MKLRASFLALIFVLGPRAAFAHPSEGEAPTESAHPEDRGFRIRGDASTAIIGMHVWDSLPFENYEETSPLMLGGSLGVDVGYAFSATVRLGWAANVTLGHALSGATGIPLTSVDLALLITTGPTLAIRPARLSPLEFGLGIEGIRLTTMGSQAQPYPGPNYRFTDELGLGGQVFASYRLSDTFPVELRATARAGAAFGTMFQGAEYLSSNLGVVIGY